MKRSAFLSVCAAACVLAAIAVVPERAFAQQNTQVGTPLKADFKGTIGLGLIGGELGMVVPSLFGARDAWVYIVFPVLGAGGGAAAGYFLLEKGAGHPEAAVATLAAGMALLIPALVVTLAETAYHPDDVDQGSLKARTAQAAAAGPGLVRWSQRGVLMAPPAIGVLSLNTPAEALRTGAPQQRVVHASLVSGVF